MLEQLMQIIQESSQDAVINNPDIPNGQNQAVMAEAGSSMLETFQQLMANGQGSQLLGLFGSNASNISSNPITNMISNTFVNNISKKLGINPTVAAGIAAIVIPLIIKKFINKTNDSQDNGLNIQDIFNKMSGGGTSGINIPDILSKFTQGGQTQSAQASSSNPMDTNGDGKVDLSDLTAAFQGAQSQGAGGLLS